jgi:hypothetical protein
MVVKSGTYCCVQWDQYYRAKVWLRSDYRFHKKFDCLENAKMYPNRIWNLMIMN